MNPKEEETNCNFQQKNETVEKESDKPDDPETNQSVHNDKDDAKGKYKEEDEDKDEADTISEEIESSQGKPERRDKPEMGERPEVQEKPEIQAKPNEMKDESETNFRPDTKRYGIVSQFFWILLFIFLLWGQLEVVVWNSTLKSRLGYNLTQVYFLLQLALMSSGQSYKDSTIVNYDSRVVPYLKIPHITTLEL